MGNSISNEPLGETWSMDKSAITTANIEEPCTILVLDEHLNRFPFESMNMVSNIAITRVPSLQFLVATLRERKKSNPSVSPPVVNPSKVKYVVDPESNLRETASTMETALKLKASTEGWEWGGVVRQMPSSEFMSKALQTENSLYLFCGHGGGENVFSISQIEALMGGQDDGIRGCRSSVVLMGCSSGKVKQWQTPFGVRAQGGIALSYLRAGAPCVVGNLWNVTDRDIDRYV